MYSSYAAHPSLLHGRHTQNAVRIAFWGVPAVGRGVRFSSSNTVKSANQSVIVKITYIIILFKAGHACPVCARYSFFEDKAAG
jgi:hypothetical protein